MLSNACFYNFSLASSRIIGLNTDFNGVQKNIDGVPYISPQKMKHNIKQKENIICSNAQTILDAIPNHNIKPNDLNKEFRKSHETKNTKDSKKTTDESVDDKKESKSEKNGNVSVYIRQDKFDELITHKKEIKIEDILACCVLKDNSISEMSLSDVALILLDGYMLLNCDVFMDNKLNENVFSVNAFNHISVIKSSFIKDQFIKSDDISNSSGTFMCDSNGRSLCKILNVPLFSGMVKIYNSKLRKKIDFVESLFKENNKEFNRKTFEQIVNDKIKLRLQNFFNIPLSHGKQGNSPCELSHVFTITNKNNSTKDYASVVYNDLEALIKRVNTETAVLTTDIIPTIKNHLNNYSDTFKSLIQIISSDNILYDFSDTGISVITTEDFIKLYE